MLFRSAIEAMEGDIRDLIYGLVEGFKSQGSGDIIADLGMPVPLTIMCWMLGTPVEDIEKFRNWVLPMAEAVAYVGGRQANETVMGAYKQYGEYFGPHIQGRMAAIERGDDVPDDLLTRLLTVEREGRKLTFQQVIGFCQFLLVAGSATTTLLIGNVLKRLMEFPNQLELVQNDRSLIPNAIEESLRFDAPVHEIGRAHV